MSAEEETAFLKKDGLDGLFCFVQRDVFII